MIEFYYSNHFHETFGRNAIIVNIIEIGRNYLESVSFRRARALRASLICTFTSIMDALGVGYVIFETISFEYCVITEMMYERMDRNDSAEKKKKERKEKEENEDSTWNIKELDE